MSLPKFETKIRDIETQMDATEVFVDFINAFTRQNLLDAAEEYVRTRMPNGSVYTFRHLEGGLLRMVCGLIVMGSTDSQDVGVGSWLDDKIADHYGFTQETIPPRMLVREAVATRIRYNSLMSDLSREVDQLNTSRVDGGLQSSLENVAAGLTSPEDGYKLPREVIDSIIRGF